MRPPPRYPDCAGSSGSTNCQGNELSRERCNVSGNVVSVPPTHCKIHLCMRADERCHEVILIKSVFSTNYLKGRRVCDDAPRTSANDVACRASILSYMPAVLDISSEGHSRHKGQPEASRKSKSIASHEFLHLIRAAFRSTDFARQSSSRRLRSFSFSSLTTRIAAFKPQRNCSQDSVGAAVLRRPTPEAALPDRQSTPGEAAFQLRRFSRCRSCRACGFRHRKAARLTLEYVQVFGKCTPDDG
jgi:hypothetical protein